MASRPTQPPQALILLAHGSRSPKAAAEMRALAARIGKTSPGFMVIGAFLSLARPDLPAAVDKAAARGAKTIVVLPMFLFTGRHADEDVPALIRVLKRDHPSMRFRLLPPLGRHAGLPALILAAARL